MGGTTVDLSAAALNEARISVATVASRTPVLEAGWLSSDRSPIRLKAECLQVTGSFKVRGVAVRLGGARPGGQAAGVVTGSAGNHAMALAYVAGIQRIPCRVFMPSTASRSKADAVRRYGGTVTFHDGSVDACLEQARQFAKDRGATMIHPFDDPLIVRGQATLGMELLEQLPDVRTVVVPIGGGGLAGGVAAVLKEANPGIRIVGVQAEVCAPVASPEDVERDVRFALADGIAIKRPGQLTGRLIERYVDELCTVSDDVIADAIVDLLQHGKVVVEGAGAVSVAAIQSGQVEPAGSGPTVALLSGGNIDLGHLAAAARAREASSERVLHISTWVPDHPGGLAPLVDAIAEAEANLVSIEHVRDAGARGFHETGIELILQTRGPHHRDSLLRALDDSGYEVALRDGAANPPPSRNRISQGPKVGD